MKISIITVNWWAKDFLELQIKSYIEKSSKEIEIEHIIVDNSGEILMLIKNTRIMKPDINLGHGGGLDLAIKKATGEYVLILDVDSHILLNNWDKILIDKFENDSKLKIACASDSGLLKPARPLAMFFKKSTIIDNNISFKSQNLRGVKFDVGVYAYFRILTLYGDKSVLKLNYKKTDFIDVLGNEYTLDGEKFVYHNWYGTRWYNKFGDCVHNKIDRIDFDTFNKKKINLFKQV